MHLEHIAKAGYVPIICLALGFELWRKVCNCSYERKVEIFKMHRNMNSTFHGICDAHEFPSSRRVFVAPKVLDLSGLTGARAI